MEKTSFSQQKGFSLIEVLLVVALLAALIAIPTINLFSPVSKAKVDSVSADIISLLQQAQNKAMNSDTEGQSSTFDYGVHFESNKYILFRGNAYNGNEADPANFVVNIPENISIVPDLHCTSAPTNCNQNIVFRRVNTDLTLMPGEVLNFELNNQSSICVTENTTGREIKLVINFVGVTDEFDQNC